MQWKFSEFEDLQKDVRSHVRIPAWETKAQAWHVKFKEYDTDAKDRRLTMAYAKKHGEIQISTWL